MGKKLMGGFLRLKIKFKYYVEITEQIKSLLSGCHGLPLDNTFNEDYCPPGYSFRFAFYYQRTLPHNKFVLLNFLLFLDHLTSHL